MGQAKAGWADLNIEGAELIAESRGEDEHRQVWSMVVPQERVVVAERSFGSVTYAAYETFSHEHELLLEWEAACALAAALGSRAARVGVALRALFSAPERCLADLMDLLDREGIPYAYASQADGILSYRPASEDA